MIEQVAMGGEEAQSLKVSQPILPFEVHAHWIFEDEEMGVPFEFMVRWEADGAEPIDSLPVELQSKSRRHRHQLTGIKVGAFGQSFIRVGIRPQGSDEWVISEAAWPLQIDFRPAEDPQADLIPPRLGGEH